MTAIFLILTLLGVVSTTKGLQIFPMTRIRQTLMKSVLIASLSTTFPVMADDNTMSANEDFTTGPQIVKTVNVQSTNQVKMITTESQTSTNKANDGGGYQGSLKR